MEIVFGDRKLEKLCDNQSRLVQKYGSRRANLLKRRLDDLGAADNLAVMRTLSHAHCHELKGDRAGTLAVDLDHPYRLVFEPVNVPIPRKPDGGLDWTKVTAIRVLTVEDYHD